MTRTEMMAKACQTFGLENEWVIAFCKACEVYPAEGEHILRTPFRVQDEKSCRGHR